MSNHVYKMIDLVGSSPTSIEDAIQSAITKAAQSVRHLRWFEVTETRGHIKDGEVAHFQVSLRAAFTLEEEDD